MIKTVLRGATAAALAVALVSGTASVAAAAEAPSLQHEVDDVHAAGMPGVQVAARNGDGEFDGTAGVADIHTGRKMPADSEHRVGSLTKSFTSAALLQQVEKGELDLDAPIGEYLPELVPGERGQQITVRMLLNHTSGIGDYVLPVFPSLAENSLKSLEEHRFQEISPEDIIKAGLSAPPTGAPGETWSYSNTNYIIAGELLRELTGDEPEEYITEHVIEPLGLKHTYFPGSDPKLHGSHSRAYEALHNRPPNWGEYSVYNMGWAGTAGALVSTPDEVNTFYRALLTGEIIGKDALAEMKKGVPIEDGSMMYGLGLLILDGQDAGWIYGHTGAVFGMETVSAHTEDGKRQLTVGTNLSKYQDLDEHGMPKPHNIDQAMLALELKAFGADEASTKSTKSMPMMPMLDRH